MTYMAATASGVCFGRVTGQAARFLIVGSGPSAEALDLSLVEKAAGSGVHIIAVNGAIEWLPVAHDWFTLDPETKNRARMRARRPGVRYMAGVPEDYGRPDAEHATHRDPPEEGLVWLRRCGGWPKPGEALSDDPAVIRSGNSMFGALGVAYLMAKAGSRIGFIGLDGTRERYAHGNGRPGRMNHLGRLFAATPRQLKARGIAVVNGSPQSRVTAYRRCRPNEAVEWVSE